jgi:hypothetical protein
MFLVVDRIVSALYRVQPGGTTDTPCASCEQMVEFSITGFELERSSRLPPLLKRVVDSAMLAPVVPKAVL